MDTREDPKILRMIAETYVTFQKLDRRLANLGLINANIFCPFHDNRHSPAAKAYYDEERSIWVIHCFAEHRTFTTYDYIKIILVDRENQYKSVKEYLLKELGETTFNEAYSLAEREQYLYNETLHEQRLTYIENLYSKYNNVTDFINALYLELDDEC